jgi:hypothetical protein
MSDLIINFFHFSVLICWVIFHGINIYISSAIVGLTICIDIVLYKNIIGVVFIIQWLYGWFTIHYVPPLFYDSYNIIHSITFIVSAWLLFGIEFKLNKKQKIRPQLIVIIVICNVITSLTSNRIYNQDTIIESLTILIYSTIYYGLIHLGSSNAIYLGLSTCWIVVSSRDSIVMTSLKIIVVSLIIRALIVRRSSEQNGGGDQEEEAEEVIKVEKKKKGKKKTVHIASQFTKEFIKDEPVVVIKNKSVDKPSWVNTLKNDIHERKESLGKQLFNT